MICFREMTFTHRHKERPVISADTGSAGKGRVFKCLQENLAQPDFGAACKAEVEERGLSMQENYKLDFGVSSACEPDVQAVCSAEKVRHPPSKFPTFPQHFAFNNM